MDPKAGVGFYADPALDGSRAGKIYLSNTPPESKLVVVNKTHLSMNCKSNYNMLLI